MKKAGGFDLSSLVQFRPPALRCPRCLAILQTISQVFPYGEDKGSCPVCRAEFIESPPLGKWKRREGWTSYLRSRGYTIDFRDPLDHVKALALATQQMNRSIEGGVDKHAWLEPPFRHLLRLLGTARSFVHIMTWGLDWPMVGILKMTATSVPVAAIVSSVGGNVRKELVGEPYESPGLEVRFPGDRDSSPHTKLIVIDGLLAITGSANLTTSAYRKVATGAEHVEIITDLERVRDFNNRFFSPQGSGLAEGSNEVRWTSDDLPF